MKRRAMLCILLVFAALLGGCESTPLQDENPQEENPWDSYFTPQDQPPAYFTISPNHGADSRKTWTVSFDGAVLEEVPDSYFLYDQATGEPQYEVMRRQENTGEKDADGNPDIKQLYALCDLDGNQLTEWDEYYYSSGLGSMVIRSRNELDENGQYIVHACLWDVPSQQEAIPDASNLQQLKSGNFLVSDSHRRVLGILSPKGEKVSGFPAPVALYNAVAMGEGFYATEKSYQEESNPREYILLNEEYQTLAVYPQFWDYPCHTDRYLLARKSANTLVVISTEDYSETYTLPEGKDLSYIDDERMILKEDNPGSTYYRFTCNLADLQGNPLSRNYAALCSDSSYEVRIPGEYFIGVVYEDGEIQKIDRDGQVLKTLSVDGVFNIYDLGNGFFVYETLPKENAYGQSLASQGVVDQDLNVIVPHGVYGYIQWAENYGTRTVRVPYLRCEKFIGSQSRIDLLSLQGEVLLENLTQLSGVWYDRAAVVRGFDQGLIGLDGNWIVKRSIFSSLEDE